MSEIQKSIDRTGIKNPMYWKIVSSHPTFGLSHSIASRTKISETKGTTIFIYDSKGLLENTFSSANKAAEHLNCSHTTILRNVNNNKLLLKNWYLFLYKEFLINTDKGSSNSKK